jgi:hypothetical protein
MNASFKTSSDKTDLVFSGTLSKILKLSNGEISINYPGLINS